MSSFHECFLSEKVLSVIYLVFGSQIIKPIITKFYLIAWCGNFLETYSFRRVLGDSPKNTTFHAMNYILQQNNILQNFMKNSLLVLNSSLI